jgi:epoxyqueuosine reductase
MVQARGSQGDENLARARLRVRDVLVPDDVGPSVFVDANGFQRQNPRMTRAELSDLASELGIDVVGAARPEPYAETERQIVERRERGLFADMRFTMARPEVSCHPELLLEGARTVVAAALCYVAESAQPKPDEGRLPRYTWRDEYAVLRDRLDALGRRLGGTYRVLVDDNAHVDRAAAVRAGVAFYGKNTMAITRRHGSWVVLGVLVTDVEIEPTPALELDCGECRLCIDACPTGALDEPGTLDATKCLSYWSQAPSAIPDAYRAEMNDMVYGCDICQDVCPWNRGVEKRRQGAGRDADAQPTVSLVDWLHRDGVELVEEYDRLYVPRNDPRWLRRNALIAAGNVGSSTLRSSVARHEKSGDPILADAARWAIARMAERGV